MRRLCHFGKLRSVKAGKAACDERFLLVSGFLLIRNIGKAEHPKLRRTVFDKIVPGGKNVSLRKLHGSGVGKLADIRVARAVHHAF